MWKKIGKFEIGLNKVEIKSIKIRDEIGKIRRMRVCSVWGNFSNFTNTPVNGYLCKDEKGYIGVLLSGKNGGYVKVGKNFLISQNLIVPINSIGKGNLKKLLKGYKVDFIEIEEVIYGIER
ncbi:MAG: hypothetical protein NC926_03725 [Candidatus Omnitrophica bacterium]|nr:hypothetical protein [Candidatus Omnitrophota bacterium]MCM8807053.1 hypothetical protein [Candidatus Omnitrophota bacterium]